MIGISVSNVVLSFLSIGGVLLFSKRNWISVDLWDRRDLSVLGLLGYRRRNLDESIQ